MKIFRPTAAAAIAAFLVMVGMAAFAADDIDSHRSCHICGMDRKAYGYSRMLTQYEDGTETGVCSLHCAVQAINDEPTRPVKKMFVADRDDRTLINAESAFWVIGGNKRGVMTQRPKWAFRTQAGAENFVEAHGGTIIPWNGALAAAREDAIPAHR